MQYANGELVRGPVWRPERADLILTESYNSPRPSWLVDDVKQAGCGCGVGGGEGYYTSVTSRP